MGLDKREWGLMEEKCGLTGEKWGLMDETREVVFLLNCSLIEQNSDVMEEKYGLMVKVIF